MYILAQADLRVNSDHVVEWLGNSLLTKSGVVMTSLLGGVPVQ
jgi:hypothetical protein